MARKLLFFCLGITAILVLAEAVLRLLPVSTATMTGYYHDPDIQTYPARHRWHMATGWDLRNPQTLNANNWGFSAERDFAPDVNAVALIGDSYVEASMLDASDRPAAQLEQRLHGRHLVYAMGTPGTALLDYAQRIRWAREKLQVRRFVLLIESGDARQSLCGSGNVVSRCLDSATLQPKVMRLPASGALQRAVRHSALAQYLFSQLRFKPASLLHATFTRTTPEDSTPERNKAPAPTLDAQQIARTRTMVDAVVAEFFASAAMLPTDQLVVMVDGRRDSSTMQEPLLDIERAHLMARLRERGAIVRDLEPLYAAHALQSQRALRVGPYDGHLNAIGVGIAAAAAADVIE